MTAAEGNNGRNESGTEQKLKSAIHPQRVNCARNPRQRMTTLGNLLSGSILPRLSEQFGDVAAKTGNDFDVEENVFFCHDDEVCG